MTLFAADWLNWARDNRWQVTFNNRCGFKGDSDTPEEQDTQRTMRWLRESGRPAEERTLSPTATTSRRQTTSIFTRENMARTLVDIVSKNGNFLLDTGLAYNGSIPQIMQKGLLDTGKWIKSHGEGIFTTRYWRVMPGNDPLSYTTTRDVFYIQHLGAPLSTLCIADPVPYFPGDKVTVVGGKNHGKPVPVTWNGIGTLKLGQRDDIPNQGR
ncbi:Glycoside hydrolase, family 29 [Tolypocladium paradoxum]|uniref:alpha-L-fucosidase n=1 Tax=Tolypocladium paradoxum TaxID=94208 RepID=A0A2S4KLR7_9HYPO|nr:Glycoside hydrolase, family 29 [Tolypocladium paradoxum]